MKTSTIRERNQRIVERVDSGESWKAVAREYGISSSRIGQILIRERGRVCATPKPLAPEEEMVVIMMTLDGAYPAEIARHLKRDQGCVKRALERNNMAPRNGVTTKASAKHAEAIRLVQSGHSYSDVADMLEVSRNVVAGAVHRWKERQRHDGLPKVSKLQRSPSQGQSSHREGQLHPEKARV